MPTWLLIVIVVVAVVVFAFFGSTLSRVASVVLGKPLRAIAGDKRVDRVEHRLNPQEPGVDMLIWARRRGYTLADDDAVVFDASWGPQFTTGANAGNVCTGTAGGFPFVCFALMNRVGVTIQGNTAYSTSHSSVIAVQLPSASGDFVFEASDRAAAEPRFSAAAQNLVATYTGPGFRVTGDHLVESVHGVTHLDGLDARIEFLVGLAAAL